MLIWHTRRTKTLYMYIWSLERREFEKKMKETKRKQKHFGRWSANTKQPKQTVFGVPHMQSHTTTAYGNEQTSTDTKQSVNLFSNLMKYVDSFLFCNYLNINRIFKVVFSFCSSFKLIFLASLSLSLFLSRLVRQPADSRLLSVTSSTLAHCHLRGSGLLNVINWCEQFHFDLYFECSITCSLRLWLLCFSFILHLRALKIIAVVSCHARVIVVAAGIRSRGKE